MPKLGDYIKIKHGRAFKGEYFSDAGKYILLTPGNFSEKDGIKYKGDKEKYYVGVFPEEYLLKKGDLLIAMTDLKQSAPYLGSPGIIKEDGICLHNQRLGLVKVINEDELDKKYVYYVFNSDYVRSKIRGSATGATVKHTAPERIYSIEFNLPPLPTQQRIANILSKYDDLIENNTRRIKILEEQAQLIYNEWFVKFQFPDHEDVKMIDSGTEFGEIPEGWKIGKIFHLISLLGGFAFKSGDYKKSGKHGIVTIKNVQDGSFKNFCDNYIDDIPDKLKDYQKLVDGDILLSLTGNVGRTCLVYGNGFLLNQRVAKLEAKKDIYYPFIYTLFRNISMLKRLESISKGVAQQNLSPIETGELDIILPSDNILKNFSNIVGAMIKEIILLYKQNQNLKETRDMLIPKLVYGEIEV